jgi:hypothetical protein
MSERPLATPSSIDELRTLIERLVGQRAVLDGPIPELAVHVLVSGSSGLGYSQLNELLLLLGFDRVSDSFFQYLVDGTTDYRDGASFGSFNELKAAIDRFRQLGLLLYGNIKYAFKALSRDPDRLAEQLARFRAIPVERFAARHDPIRPVRSISPERTYYLGYVVEGALRERLKNPDDVAAVSEEQLRQAVVQTGKANHEAYLAGDHLDVYVATSMRQRHEYLAVNRLSSAIFGHADLKDLKLRWFDPTQAYCKDRIDKGLAEALMLRRAKCTIYLAQETDTLGKDSELASTLAQGKSVIAFVPAVEAGYAKQLVEELKQAYPDRHPVDLMLEQLQIFDPTAAWTDASVRRWLDDRAAALEADVEARLQSAIQKHYDSRYKLLRETHPLGIQVNLASGVANGVLVVRTVDACAKLVRCIVTRTLQFYVNEEDSALVLRERISDCVFRIATKDLMLTNAFWNFYLEPSE